MSNENSQDKIDDKKTEQRQPETGAETNARADANRGISDYTEQVKTHRAEKKISGNSGATGQLKDDSGKGLASAKDLLGDDAHGLTKNEKQAAILAQIERDGYIVGQKGENNDLLAQAHKDDPLTKLKNKFEHPGRNNPDAAVDYPAAKEAYQRFDLEKYGVDKALIPGIIRNEQYWLGPKDRVPDFFAEERPFLMPLKDRSWSVGPAQIQVRIMEELVEKYQDKLPEFKPSKQVVRLGGMELAQREADTAMLSFDNKNAALITGAYFANVIDRLEQGKPPCPYSPDKDNAKIRELWKQGSPESKQEALIRSFNPGSDEHVKNVLNHVREIKKTHAEAL
jgi:hypothetical protein